MANLVSSNAQDSEDTILLEHAETFSIDEIVVRAGFAGEQGLGLTTTSAEAYVHTKHCYNSNFGTMLGREFLP